MSGGFSAAWLALREPADARARARGAPALVEWLGALASSVPRGAAREIVDLGAGRGANRHFLGPRLPGDWRWTLVDHDPALLRLAATGPDVPAQRVLDLARDLDALALPEGGVVTASALLDLVSASWLEQLAARCTAAGAAILFALTYDGRTTCKPIDHFDRCIVSLVNRHQAGDKGFGPALGPAAAAEAARVFAALGYRCCRVASDWRLGPDEAPLQAELLEGWARAAAELAPGERRPIEAWLTRRRRHLDRGRSWITVGHEDLYGWPSASTGGTGGTGGERGQDGR